MRILHWCDSFWPQSTGIGGAQIWLTDLCREQVALGHQVAVATKPCPGQEAAQRFEDIEVYRWPLAIEHCVQSPRLIRENVRACGEIKRSFQPEMIHAHLVRFAAWFNLLSRDAWSCPTILTVHLPEGGKLLTGPLKRHILEEASLVVAVSADAGRQMIASHDRIKNKLRVIPNGLAWPAIPPVALSFSPPTILCLGRLVEAKGFDVALRALGLMQRRDVRMIIAGAGEARAALEQLVTALKLDAQVEFRGWVNPDEVSALINEASIVLMPSRWREPFGLVAVQAAQMGRPVVGTRMGGIPEIVQDGETGILVEPEQPLALAQAMEALIDDPDHAQTLGIRARARAKEHFSIGRCAENYEKIYREAAEPHLRTNPVEQAT